MPATLFSGIPGGYPKTFLVTAPPLVSRNYRPPTGSIHNMTGVTYAPD